jgi:hypothetical protein
MQTLSAVIHQERQLKIRTRQRFMPVITGSARVVLSLLSGMLSAVAIVLLFTWLSTVGINDILAACTCGVAFIFLGLAVDNRGKTAVLQAVTGLIMFILAWLQNSVSADYAVASGILLGMWVAVMLYRQLR